MIQPSNSGYSWGSRVTNSRPAWATWQNPVRGCSSVTECLTIPCEILGSARQREKQWKELIYTRHGSTCLRAQIGIMGQKITNSSSARATQQDWRSKCKDSQRTKRKYEYELWNTGTQWVKKRSFLSPNLRTQSPGYTRHAHQLRYIPSKKNTPF